MALHPIDIAILLLYLAAIVAVGFVAKRHASKGMSQYFLGKTSFRGGC